MIRLLNRLIFIIKRFFKEFNIIIKSKNKKYTHLYIGSPIHGNLGDQQIRVSTVEMLKNLKIKFIEINMEEYFLFQEINFKYIKTVILHGGGNIGDEYLQDNLIRDHAIRKFADKKIIIFPQTIFYKNQNSVNLKIAEQIYNNHKNLILTLREQTSYNLAKKYFDCKLLLTPDIVLYSDYRNKLKRKDRVLFLMRNDVEKSLTDDNFSNVLKQVKGLCSNIKFSDTTIKTTKYTTNRKHSLKKKFKLISSSKLVITDRLHGMIFSVITGTPCIVFSNYNHKIKSTYEWLKDLNYIYFVDDINKIDIEKIYENLLNVKPNYKSLKEKYKKLIDEIIIK